jgi:hypothetical protein
MAYHRFRIGQQVVASAFGVPPGSYEITRLLPLAEGVPYYRAKSLGDGHERALSEHSLRPAPTPANISDAPPRRSKAAKAG